MRLYADFLHICCVPRSWTFLSLSFSFAVHLPLLIFSDFMFLASNSHILLELLV